MKKIRLGYIVVIVAALLGGCSRDTGSNDGGNATPTSLQGVVHGGQAPIAGSAVTLYAASQQDQASAAVVATATTDSNGNYSFNFSCPSPTTQMYVTSIGGNPGGGVNSAIHLMSILGQCQSLHRSSTVNELTTVAAAYTANNFIGPSGCDDCGGGLPAAVDNITGPAPGMPNAMGNAALVVSSVTGLDAPSLPTSAECPASGTVPANCLTVRKLNTAANALAACVNSAGPTSAQCVQLFDCATVGAAFSSSTACTPPTGAALPTNTLQAMLNIVRNPVTISVPGIDDTANRDVVFSPAASGHFNDYTLSLNLTAGINEPDGLAVDGDGNIWVSNDGDGTAATGTVTKLSPSGVPLAYGPNGNTIYGGNGFPVGAFPVGIAFDTNGYAWIANYNASSVTVLSATGASLFGSPITSGGISNPDGVAVSPNGVIWITDVAVSGSPHVSRFTSSAAPVGTGYSTGNYPATVAVDASGYVFVANYYGGTISQFQPNGTLLATITDPSSGPSGIAVDINGNVWVANATSSGALFKINLSNEKQISTATFTGGGLSYPSGLATDGAGNVWVSNNYGVSEFNNAGTPLSPSAGFVGAGPYDYAAPAVDPSGNVWFVNTSAGNSVTVFFGAAAPTRTPLVAAMSQGFVP